jgi:hypothetical protein
MHISGDSGVTKRRALAIGSYEGGGLSTDTTNCLHPLEPGVEDDEMILQILRLFPEQKR